MPRNKNLFVALPTKEDLIAELDTAIREKARSTERLRPHFARLLAAEALSRGRIEVHLLAESVVPNDAERPDFQHVARDAVNHMPLTFDTVRGMYMAWSDIVNQNESNDVNATTLTPRKLERELRDILAQQIEGLADHIEQEWNAIQRKRAVTRP